MSNILTRYIKQGIVTIGDDGQRIDTPQFEIIDVDIDTVGRTLSVRVMHYAQQGSLEQQHERTFTIPFSQLPAPIQQSGLTFLQAIQTAMLQLPRYSGATPAP